ncbi:MAG: MFS transporter [Acidimicrobiales bacterium]|nr:MFS transporter [Acidimicrobiales bacterium]
MTNAATPPSTGTAATGIQLGLRENLPQFGLLVLINALVGATVGQERTVLPLLAEDVFGLSAYSAMLSFIAVFGVSKAITNLFAGTLGDRYGRKPVLIIGWLVAIPVPLLLIWAPTWGWVLFANVLLGINQGLTWSLTVIMKIDLVGPARRGLAMGLNEGAGYGAVAAAAWATGWIASEYGLRPEPFYLGIGLVIIGLGLSMAFVRETSHHVAHEAANHVQRDGHPGAELTSRQVFALSTWRNPSLSAASQAGLVNNLNEGMAWGLFPLFFAAGGVSVGKIGGLIAIAPAVWGVGQLFTGALSDKVGRKWLIAGGQFAEATGLTIIALGNGFGVWALGSAVFGAGTAMAYPTLIAAIGDVAHPTWRASAVGVYRLWRDLGFAVGAVLAGVLADVVSIEFAILIIAGITAASGLDVSARMRETLHRPPLPVVPD